MVAADLDWSSVLRELRLARGVTQASWAARLGVSRMTVLRCDRATWNPFTSITHVLWSLGNVARDQGDHAAARSLYAEGLAAAQEQGGAFHVAVLLDSFASLAISAGTTCVPHDCSVQPRPCAWPATLRWLRSTAATSTMPSSRPSRAACTDAATLDAAWAEERGMSWEQASVYALAGTTELQGARGRATRPHAGDTPVYPDRLTAREVEVLRLLAAGLTGREIAERLVLSVRTVDPHLGNIYAKIGARGKGSAVAYAVRHGLVPPH